MSDKTINDGGPAFPSGESDYEGAVMLRDYFAAHAPAEPRWRFEVRMPRPRPEAVMVEGQYGRDCANAKELQEWDDERDRQRAIQWPYAFADAMLAERQKARSE